MAESADPDRPRWGIAPYFLVDDVVATANYYREKLGFGYERFWGDPPAFCMVWRNGVIIMLSQLEQSGIMRPNHAVDPEGGAWDAYIWVERRRRALFGVHSRGASGSPATSAIRLWVPRLRCRGLQRVQALLWAEHRMKLAPPHPVPGG